MFSHKPSLILVKIHCLLFGMILFVCFVFTIKKFFLGSTRVDCEHSSFPESFDYFPKNVQEAEDEKLFQVFKNLKISVPFIKNEFEENHVFNDIPLKNPSKAICGPKPLKAIMPSIENNSIKMATEAKELSYFPNQCLEVSDENLVKKVSMMPSFEDFLSKPAFQKSSSQNFPSQPIKSCLMKKSPMRKIGKQVSFFPREKLHTFEKQKMDFDGSNLFKRYGFENVQNENNNDKFDIKSSFVDTTFLGHLQKYQVNVLMKFI